MTAPEPERIRLPKFGTCLDPDTVAQQLDLAAMQQSPLVTDDCPICGHLLLLHSRARACLGCRLEPPSGTAPVIARFGADGWHIVPDLTRRQP